MRGGDSYIESLFTTVRLEEFVPANHPLRPIRAWVNDALAKMDEKFSAMYEADITGGRPSIAPEKLMRAMPLQVLFSVRSERQLVEQIQYNLLFRWFVGLAIEDTVWNHSVFSKNRDRLIEHDIVTELFNATVAMAKERDCAPWGNCVRKLRNERRMLRNGIAEGIEWPRKDGLRGQSETAAGCMTASPSIEEEGCAFIGCFSTAC